MKILVVEDMPSFRKVLVNALRAQEHDVVWAEDGREAMRILRKEKIDLVLSDVGLPYIDGYELFNKVKKDHKGLQFVLYSSSDSETLVKLAEDLGIPNFIPDAGNNLPAIHTAVKERFAKAVEATKRLLDGDKE